MSCFLLFYRPVPRASTAVPELPLTLEPAIEPPADEENKTVKVKEKTYDKKIQTMYRESSAQTSPWQPDYKVIDGSDPEILKLDFLKWGNIVFCLTISFITLKTLHFLFPP